MADGSDKALCAVALHFRTDRTVTAGPMLTRHGWRLVQWQMFPWRGSVLVGYQIDLLLLVCRTRP